MRFPQRRTVVSGKLSAGCVCSCRERSHNHVVFTLQRIDAAMQHYPQLSRHRMAHCGISNLLRHDQTKSWATEDHWGIARCHVFAMDVDDNSA